MKYTLTREQQTTGYEVYKQKDGEYAVYLQKVDDNTFLIKAFKGKSAKHSFFYRVKGQERIDELTNNLIKQVEERKDYMLKRKEERLSKRRNMDVSHIVSGMVFHDTYGYNCTRNEYVKIIGTAGKNKFLAVKLGKYQVDGDWMNGNVGPVLESGDVSKAITLTAYPYFRGEICLKDPKGYNTSYTRWNGKPNWDNCD